MPLKQKSFHVLLALEPGPLHGYAIRKRVLDTSEGRLELEPGGLYRLIARLDRDGLIEPTEQPPEDDSTDERRVYYALTPAGRAALVEDAKWLSGLVRRPEVESLIADGSSA